jgi:hypothetical protein
MRAWYYGPDGAAAIFERAEDIPAGWADAPGGYPTHPLDRDRNGRLGGSFPRKDPAPSGGGGEPNRLGGPLPRDHSAAPAGKRRAPRKGRSPDIETRKAV